MQTLLKKKKTGILIMQTCLLKFSFLVKASIEEKDQLRQA